ncbi:MAG: hypothetical protein Q7T20_07255 [Saprospiraceae bacterium]|nr:hypothetical protein [Saprospiraceae bacterium]
MLLLAPNGSSPPRFHALLVHTQWYPIIYLGGRIAEEPELHTLKLDDVATFTFDKDKLNLFVRRGIGFGR